MQVSRRIPVAGLSGWQINVSRAAKPSRSPTGPTAAEFLREPRLQFSKRSVVAFVASELRCVPVALTPKSTLTGVFQAVKRAVHASKSRRIGGRFAASSLASLRVPVAFRRKPLPSQLFVEGPATLQ